MLQTVFVGHWHQPRTPWTNGPRLGGLGIVGLLTTSVALLLMWALLTEPVQLARAIDHGGSAAIAQVLWTTVSELVVKLLAWI
jgi:hypothetical protein